MTPAKVSFGTQLPPELVARLRARVIELQRTDPSLTIAMFTEQALTAALDASDSTTLPSVAAARPRVGRRIGAVTKQGS